MLAKRKFYRLEGRGFSAESEGSGLTSDGLDLGWVGFIVGNIQIGQQWPGRLHSRPNSCMFVILRRAEDAQNAFKWTING